MDTLLNFSLKNCLQPTNKLLLNNNSSQNQTVVNNNNSSTTTNNNTAIGNLAPLWNEQLATLLLNASGVSATNFSNNNNNQFPQQQQQPQLQQQTVADLRNNNIGYDTLLLALAKLPLNPYANLLFNNSSETTTTPATPNEQQQLTTNLTQSLLSPVKMVKNYDFGLATTKVADATSPPPAKRVCLLSAAVAQQDISKNDFLPVTNCAAPQQLRTTSATPNNNINNNINGLQQSPVSGTIATTNSMQPPSPPHLSHLLAAAGGSSSSCNSVTSSTQNSPVASSRRRMSTTSTTTTSSSFGGAVSANSRNRTPQRKPAAPIPDEKKDEAYYERRKKNNDAAKRSRDSRRQKEELTANRAAYLEQENIQLKGQIALYKAEIAKLHSLFLTTSNNKATDVADTADSINNNNNIKESDAENGAGDLNGDERSRIIKPEPVYEPVPASEDSSPLKLLSALLSAKTQQSTSEILLASPEK